MEDDSHSVSFSEEKNSMNHPHQHQGDAIVPYEDEEPMKPSRGGVGGIMPQHGQFSPPPPPPPPRHQMMNSPEYNTHQGQGKMYNGEPVETPELNQHHKTYDVEQHRSPWSIPP